MRLVVMALLVAASPLVMAAQITGNTYSASENSSGTATFTVTNNDAVGHTFTFSCSTKNPASITGCAVVPFDEEFNWIWLSPSQSATVQVSFTTGQFGRGLVRLHATALGQQGIWGSGASTIDVISPPRPAAISTAPHADQYLNPVFQATASFSTPAYVSGGQPRSLTLFYGSASAQPKGYVEVEATNNAWPAAAKVSIRLKRNGAYVTDQELFYSLGAGPTRVAAQFDASLDTTGLYPVVAEFRTYFSDSIVPSSTTLDVPILSKRPALGAGWGILGVQRLTRAVTGTQADELLIDEGDGTLLRFTAAGSCSVSCVFTSSLDHSRVEYISGYGYNRAYPDSTRMTFSPGGQILWQVTPTGDSTKFWYSTSATGETVLSYVVDPVGKQTHIAYATATSGGKLGSLRRIWTPGGRENWFYVDAAGDLVNLHDADGVMGLNLTYDAHRLTRRLDRRNSEAVYAYDHAGRLRADTLPAIAVNGSTLTRPVIRYDSPAARTLVDLPSGIGTFDNPKPAVIGWQGSVTDAGGHTTASTLNVHGAPLTITDPMSRTTTLAYSGLRPTRIDYPNGDWQTYAYSGAHLTQVQSSGSPAVNLGYNWAGLVDSVYGPGRVTVRNYNSGSLTDSVAYGGAVVARYYWSWCGGVCVDSTKDAEGHVTKYHYETTWRNLDSVSAAGGRYAKVLFDSAGRAHRSKSNETPWRRMTFDVLNRVRQSYDSVGGAELVTQFDYDAGLLTRVQDPKGQVYRFTYNALGLPVKQYDPADTLSRYDSTAYTLEGLVHSVTTRRNNRIEISGYDADHRPATRSGPGMLTANFVNDTMGRRAVDSNTVVRRETYWAANGWMDSVVTTLLDVNQRVRIHYRADSLQRLDSVGISSGSIAFTPRRYHYNAATGMTDSTVLGSTRLEHWYDPERMVSGIWFPSARVDATGTSIHRPSAVTYFPSALQPFSRGYGYDSVGRVSEVLHERGTNGVAKPTQFYYDQAGRLISARRYESLQCPTAQDTVSGYGFNCIDDALGPGTPLYVYDSVGNRHDRAGQYTVGNRLAFFEDTVTNGGGGWEFEFNADGSLTRKFWYSAGGLRDRRYEYSADGLLKKVWRLEGGLADSMEFAYSATGQLTRRTRNSIVERYYLWDGLNLLAELDGSGANIAEYVHQGVDQPLALITAGSGGSSVVRYFAQDELGNVMGIFSAIAGQTASIAQRLSYSDWGAPTRSGTLADTNSLGWKGLIWQDGPAQLYYMRNRWYDPDLGRFITEDPIGLNGGINQYVFAVNDAVNGFDPLGLCPYGNPDKPSSAPRGTRVDGPYGEFECDGNTWRKVGLGTSWGGGGGGGGGGSGGGGGGGHWRGDQFSTTGDEAGGGSRPMSFPQATARAAVVLMEHPRPICGLLGRNLAVRFAQGHVVAHSQVPWAPLEANAGKPGWTMVSLPRGRDLTAGFPGFLGLMAHEEIHHIVGPHEGTMFTVDTIERVSKACAGTN